MSSGEVWWETESQGSTHCCEKALPYAILTYKTLWEKIARNIDFKENGFSECFVITDKGNKRACRVYEKAGGKNDFEDEIVYVIKHA